jgi:glucose/arabinose dehydrogenase
MSPAQCVAPRHRASSAVVALFLIASLVGCSEQTVPATTGSPPPSSPVATVAAPSPTPSPSPAASPTPSLSPTPPPLLGLELQVVAKDLNHPLDAKARPGDGEIWVIEQRGVMKRITDGGVEEVLDIRSLVNDASIEQGLLGFAFHPKYPEDPRVFVYHSKANNDNVLASYETSGDPNVLDPATRKDVLVIDKAPDMVRHNAGTVLFGPDGLLYLSVGDAAQARVNGQDPANLPGSVLRIDVDAGDPYAIPAGNPFGPGGTAPAGLKGAPEVWWFGLRNPWRFSIDAATGLAYVGDVGQERIEEVNVVPLAEGGLNFGWPTFEGSRPYSNVTAVSDVTKPVLEIAHNDADGGCSVTGGEVYRGMAIPELAGTYFYADWCRGWIRSFRFADGVVADAKDWSAELKVETVSSFGHDAGGELLVLDWQADTVSRIVPVRQAP